MAAHPAAPSPAPGPPAAYTLLPSEIWSQILSFVPDPNLQRTTYALILALPPGAPISPRHLVSHLHLRQPAQAKALLMRLVRAKAGTVGEAEREWADWVGGEGVVESFRAASWSGDPSFVINLLPHIPHIRFLLLNVGPTFAPEHLFDAFHRPLLSLHTLSLRFYPYLKRRSYYQFLKGAYFDSALERLATTWLSNSALDRISIIQDVPPLQLQSDEDGVAPAFEMKAGEEEDAEELLDHSTHLSTYSGAGGPMPWMSNRMSSALPKTFANPIVFFNLTHCLSLFATSPLASHVKHLRLRVPFRDVATPLSVPNALPNLETLDISTSFVRVQGQDANLAPLLRRHPRLTHLVLDHTNLFGLEGYGTVARDRGRAGARLLGRMCATAGLVRAKAAETAVNEWVAEQRALAAPPPAVHTTHPGGPILPPAEELPLPALPSARRRQGRRGFQASFSIRDDAPGQSSTSASSGLSPAARAHLANAPVQYLVLPSPPALRALSLGVEDRVRARRRREWAEEFERGWREGCERVVGALEEAWKKWERAGSKREMEERVKEKEGANTTARGSSASSSAAASGRAAKAKKDKAYLRAASRSSASSSSTSSTTRQKPKHIELLVFHSASSSEPPPLPFASTLPPSFPPLFPHLRACPEPDEVRALLAGSTDLSDRPPVFDTKAYCEAPPKPGNVRLGKGKERAEDSGSGSESESEDEGRKERAGMEEWEGDDWRVGSAHEMCRGVWRDVDEE